jgi:hypothetical protein
MHLTYWYPFRPSLIVGSRGEKFFLRHPFIIIGLGEDSFQIFESKGTILQNIPD